MKKIASILCKPQQLHQPMGCDIPLPCGCEMKVHFRSVGADGTVNVLEKDFMHIKIKRCPHCMEAFKKAVEEKRGG